MLPVLSGIVVAIISAAVTAYLARRAKSGRIETSEAKDLWDTLRAELARLQAETTTLRAEIVTAHLEMTALREEATKVRAQMAELTTALAVCQATNDALQARLKAATRARRKP